MDTKLIKLAVERLSDEVEQLKKDVHFLQKENEQLKKGALSPFQKVQQEQEPKKETELLDARQVSTLLGVCYNTVKRMIKTGKIPRIQINQRRFKFQKSDVLAYLEAQRK